MDVRRPEIREGGYRVVGSTAIRVGEAVEGRRRKTSGRNRSGEEKPAEKKKRKDTCRWLNGSRRRGR